MTQSRQLITRADGVKQHYKTGRQVPTPTGSTPSAHAAPELEQQVPGFAGAPEQEAPQSRSEMPAHIKAFLEEVRTEMEGEAQYIFADISGFDDLEVTVTLNDRGDFILAATEKGVPLLSSFGGTSIRIDLAGEFEGDYPMVLRLIEHEANALHELGQTRSRP